MKDGFLDDVEKVIDNFSADKKEKINSKIENNMRDSWGYKWEYDERPDREEELFRRSRHTMYNQKYQPSMPRMETSLNYGYQSLKCECNASIDVVSRREKYNYELQILRRYDFYCPRCGKMWCINTCPVEIKIKME